MMAPSQVHATPEPASKAGPGRTSYSLLTEPFLLARTAEGVREIGILEAFTQASSIKGLAGEIPTQEAACLRLLLAILYRAVHVNVDDPISTWEPWWNERRLPIEDIRAYLDQYADRFDLLHPSAPFFQVADLRTGAGSTSGLGKAIAEVPDGWQFFTTRSGDQATSLSFAEAARWLVHVHAYDYSGIKSGAVGDPRVKGGRGYPLGTGFTGSLGLIVAEGSTLTETLLLNLVLRAWRPDDRVPWETPSLTSAPDPAHPYPAGPADAATWQSRRARLIHDGRHVTDMVLSYGDPLGPQNRAGVEPLTAWRYSEPQSKKLGGTIYMPLQHQPSRALWRGLGGILGLRQTDAATKAGVAAFNSSGLTEWLSELKRDRILPESFPVTLRAIGMAYGPQSSSVATVIDDRLIAPLTALVDPEVMQCAVDAADAAETAVAAIGRLASNLADASGRHLLPGQDNGARDRATETAFGLLDGPYRRWLTTLSTSELVEQRRREWQMIVRAFAQRVATELIDAAGMPAVIGRSVNNTFLNSAKAEIFFRAGLRKALPYAFPRPAGESSTPRESL